MENIIDGRKMTKKIDEEKIDEKKFDEEKKM